MCSALSEPLLAAPTILPARQMASASAACVCAHDSGAHAGHGCGHGHGHVHGHLHDDGHTHDRDNIHMPCDGAHRSGPPGCSGGQPRSDDCPVGSFAQSMQWLSVHDPAECRSVRPCMPFDCEQARCDHSQLNTTTNMLVLLRANELVTMSRVNTFLAMISVFYVAVTLVCAILNSYDNDCDPGSEGCSPATTPQTFHNLEFGATFVFNTVDVFALSYSPRTLSNQYHNPTLLKLLVLFNVCLSLASFLLVAINLEKFEVLSHELEYTNEVTMTIFDMAILINLARGRTHETRCCRGDNCMFCITVLVAGCVAGVQLGVYNLSGWTADGDSKGEQAAHYLEFMFGCVSAGITFWFTMDNKFCAEQRLRHIMYKDLESAL
mmetsp:Transcript_87383/g.282325  ORF Transcript_87383/g.282325 Transcript_87383/m.282325 type:complete len:379 (+) Transcript_87383:57-1193(+)